MLEKRVINDDSSKYIFAPIYDSPVKYWLMMGLDKVIHNKKYKRAFLLMFQVHLPLLMHRYLLLSFPCLYIFFLQHSNGCKNILVNGTLQNILQTKQ